MLLRSSRSARTPRQWSDRISLRVLAHHSFGSTTTCMDYTSNDTTSIEVNGHWISPFATRVEFGLNQPDTLRTNGRRRGVRRFRQPSMYQRCINPRCTGLCRPVRSVSTCPHIIPARWHNLTRSGTNRYSPRSPFFGFASRGSWVRFPSSPPSVNRRDVRHHGERHAVTRAVGALDRAGDHSRSSRRVSPLRNASTTSWARSRARSLVIARLTWVFTVNGDR